MMSSAAQPVEIIPGPSRKPFRDRAKTVRLPTGITVRLQPGIVFVFTPERFSRSPRNPFRLAPESATGPVFQREWHGVAAEFAHSRDFVNYINGVMCSGGGVGLARAAK